MIKCELNLEYLILYGRRHAFILEQKKQKDVAYTLLNILERQRLEMQEREEDRKEAPHEKPSRKPHRPKNPD